MLRTPQRRSDHTPVNRLKNLPGWTLLVLIGVLMAVGAAGSMWAAGTRPDPTWQGFWSGIATTCVGIFGTVFLVDQLLKRVEERRRSGLALHVRQRVSRIAFYETVKLIALLGEPGTDEPRPPSRRDDEDIHRLPDGFAEVVETTISGLLPRLAQLDADDWPAVGMMFDRMTMEYVRLISLFGYEMEVEVLRLMLRAEESAHRLSGVIAERTERRGDHPAAAANETSIMTTKSFDLISLHIAHIMRANVKLLRRV